jgi:hypothetical protein
VDGLRQLLKATFARPQPGDNSARGPRLSGGPRFPSRARPGLPPNPVARTAAQHAAETVGLSWPDRVAATFALDWLRSHWAPHLQIGGCCIRRLLGTLCRSALALAVGALAGRVLEPSALGPLVVPTCHADLLDARLLSTRRPAVSLPAVAAGADQHRLATVATSEQSVGSGLGMSP